MKETSKDAVPSVRPVPAATVVQAASRLVSSPAAGTAVAMTVFLLDGGGAAGSRGDRVRIQLLQAGAAVEAVLDVVVRAVDGAVHVRISHDNQESTPAAGRPYGRAPSAPARTLALE
ncbi:hypothetical protein TUSST3_30310 [Streptomyces sp. TUS-ST3]|nr:hypothetical protein TUSST3_30310 [Streptomyces sp. TUS-ST3]